jgi:hypothetical protein
LKNPILEWFFWDMSTELGCHSKCHAYRAWMLCQKSYFGNETPNPIGLSDLAPTSAPSKKSCSWRQLSHCSWRLSKDNESVFFPTTSTLHGDNEQSLLSTFFTCCLHIHEDDEQSSSSFSYSLHIT